MRRGGFTASLVFLSLVLPAGGLAATGASHELVSFGGSWSYRDDGVDLHSTDAPYFSDDLDDSGWKRGIGRLGYGDDGEDTVVRSGPAGERHIATYFRKRFEFREADAPPFDRAVLSLYVDDGAVVYLNGVELRRVNIPAGSIDHLTAADTDVRGDEERTVRSFDFDAGLLREGSNLVAVAVHQHSSTSPDLGFDLRVALTRDLFFRGERVGPPRSSGEEILMRDVDRDGRQDLIYSFYRVSSEIQFRRNLGRSLLSPEVVIDPDYADVNHLLSEDLDGDGDPDVVAAGAGGSLQVGFRVYRNVGSGFEESQRVEGIETRGILLADLNGDGFADLVSQPAVSPYNLPDDIEWRGNLRDGTFGVPRTVGSARVVFDLASADLNGDGRIDIIASPHDEDRVIWFENLGGRINRFGPAREIATGVDSPSKLVTGDFDGDGDEDLFASQLRGATFWYENDGAGNFGRRWGILPTQGTRLAQAADMDGDGDVDLIYKASDPNDAVVWNENDGKGHFLGGRKMDPFALGVHAAGITTGDYDGDGHRDILIDQTSSDPLQLYRNRTGSPPNIVSFEAAGNTAPAGAEVTLNWVAEGASEIRIDGRVVDGGSTVATVGPGDTTFLLTARNAHGLSSAVVTVFVPKTRFATRQLLHSNDGFDRILSLETGDVDQNGTIDIVFCSYQNSAFGWIPNAGNEVFAAPRFLSRDLEDVAGSLIFDVDSDGDPDLLAVSPSHPLVWFENFGRTQFRPMQVIGDLMGHRVKAIDVNSDGILDLVVQDRGFSPTKAVLRDSAGGFSAPIELGFGRGDDFTIIDADEDGILDYVRFSSTSSWFFPGDDVLSFSREGVQMGGNTSDPGAFLFADFDGDGRLDLIPAERSGSHLSFVKGRGHGIWEDWFFGIAEVPDLEDAVAGDFDNDGDLDVAFYSLDRGPAPDFVHWIENDGRAVFSGLQVVSGAVPGGRLMVASDLNRDGFLDLVIADEDDNIHWMSNLGGTAPFTPGATEFDFSIHPGEGLDGIRVPIVPATPGEIVNGLRAYAPDHWLRPSVSENRLNVLDIDFHTEALPVGTHTGTVTVWNGQHSRQLRVTVRVEGVVPGPPQGAIADSSLDSDADGLADLLEVAMGWDPEAPDPGPPIVLDQSESGVIARFTRDPASEHLELFIETSTDLGDWQRRPAHHTTSSHPSGLHIYQADLGPLGTSRTFARLRVEAGTASE